MNCLGSREKSDKALTSVLAFATCQARSPCSSPDHPLSTGKDVGRRGLWLWFPLSFLNLPPGLFLRPAPKSPPWRDPGNRILCLLPQALCMELLIQSGLASQVCWLLRSPGLEREMQASLPGSQLCSQRLLTPAPCQPLTWATE